MSMQDPVADMLTRIRNAQRARHVDVTFNCSKLLEQLANVLKEEGYVQDFFTELSTKGFRKITIKLKYYQGKPVIERIKRISSPGLRVYKKCDELRPIPGFGIAILSTSQGVMTHVAAKVKAIGGEVLCEVA